ncbi:hypothetical protein I546_6413 [Mycobacterium kansasii 732]|uniref:Uncharacterized protein n=1 Tax=Mycobacterium kansasii TaxID=1768 RepID=A0A1V3WX02_MYCKA|nr:hypothetical protein I546_6413 [Mycobacterium kansasii 732]OOK70821.1 hypothetical protein BZL30_6645 [Mycobacterium kansasii]
MQVLRPTPSRPSVSALAPLHQATLWFEARISDSCPPQLSSRVDVVINEWWER